MDKQTKKKISNLIWQIQLKWSAAMVLLFEKNIVGKRKAWQNIASALQ